MTRDQLFTEFEPHETVIVGIDMDLIHDRINDMEIKGYEMIDHVLDEGAVKGYCIANRKTGHRVYFERVKS